MTGPDRSGSSSHASRRDFLKGASAATVLLGSGPLGHVAHARGADTIRVGLIGCGGRGTGAAINATNAGTDVRVTALADLFRERLDEARGTLKAQRPAQADVPDNRCFVGFDAASKLIQSDVDVVLIAPASHFTPAILQMAVAAGKHVFCEKPHGIDVPGLKIAATACEEARSKGLSVVSGLCWRYDRGVQETMKRIHDGAIGKVVAIQETYVSRPYVVRERVAGHTEIESQFWNWYHFNWLSGDQTSQQLIHSLDKASWALGDRPPLQAWGMGGRQTCLEPRYGDQLDHQAVVFEYPDGVRVFGFCRDQDDCHTETSDMVLGTRGRCDVLKNTIEGATNWRYDGPRPSMYDEEHRVLFEGIRAGKPVHNGNYMILSTALGILSQMACYTGQSITWDEAMKSTRSFALPRYGFDVEPPVRPGPDGRYPTVTPGPAERALWLGA
jgi:predicted dehydrogenase